MTLVVLLLALGCGGAGSGDGGDEPFYADKVLEVLVPFGPGGGSDTWARTMAPYLQARLGDGAAVQVVNVAGASSVAGANEFALRRRADGLTALVSSGSTHLPALLHEPMVRYDFLEFTPIIASPLGGVVFVSPELGVDGVEGLLQTDEQLVYGGISATGNDLIPLLAFELLDLEVQAILGYSGKGAARIAFEQGETNIDYQTMPAYLTSVLPLVESGDAVPLFSFGILDGSGSLVRDPAVPDLPTVAEVYEGVHGTTPSGPAWDAYRSVLVASVTMAKGLWLHGDAPPAAVEALRSATDAMLEDDSFLETARAEVGDYPFYRSDEIRPLVERSRLDADTLDWLRSLLQERYGVERLAGR